MTLRLLCFSDLHRDVAAARRLAGRALATRFDALVSAGDLGLDGLHEPGLAEALARPGVDVLAVRGNHDGVKSRPADERAGWTYLDGRIVERAGWWFAGLGLPPLDGTAAAPDQRHADATLAGLLEQLTSIPADRLVIVSHLPPAGTLAARDRRWVDRGSALLAAWVGSRQPAAVVCGHVHHLEPVRERLGETLIVNPGPIGAEVSLGSPEA